MPSSSPPPTRIRRSGSASSGGSRPGYSAGGCAGFRWTASITAPLARAAQTAHLVAGSLPGVPVQPSELLTDRTPVPYPGQEGDHPSRFHPLLASVPAAEQDQGGAQITAAIRHFAALGGQAGEGGQTGKGGEAGEGHHLLITHGFVLGWFVRDALDAPAWRWLGLNLFNAGLTIIRYPADQPARLISFNDVGHLPLEVRGRTPVDLLS